MSNEKIYTSKQVTPDIPITDARFKYTPSVNTDIRRTFERFRIGSGLRPRHSIGAGLEHPKKPIDKQ